MRPAWGPRRVDGRARWPIGLLGMVALIALVELTVIAPRDLWFSEGIPHRWKYTGQMASSPEILESQILCLGDSQVMLGVAPTILERITGKTAFNLAVPGSQAPSTYAILQRAIDAGARPEAIVVGFFPGLLAVNQIMNLRNWPELLDTRETLELAWKAQAPPLFLRITLARLFASIRQRDEIRRRIIETFAGTPNTLNPALMAHRRNWQINRGAQVAPSLGNFQEELPGQAFPEMSARSWKPESTNALYLERLLKLAAQHDIQVIWIMPTISPALQAQRDANGLDAAYERYARHLVARHPNLIVADARRSNFELAAFRDTTHLARLGAATLSVDLASILNTRHRLTQTADRWQTMPTYRAEPIQMVLEDVEQSRAALAVADDGERRR